MKFWFSDGAWVSRKAQRVVNTLSRDRIRNIAVIRHAALGDMVLTRAFLIEARKAFPNAEITLSIVSNFTLGCPEDLVDRIHIVHGKDQRDAPLREKIRRFRELGPQDLIFDLAATNRSFKTVLLNKARLKIGFPYRVTQKRLFYDVAIQRSDLNFEVTDMLNMLHIFGIKTAYPHEYNLPGAALERDRPYIIYFPGASTPEKAWPFERLSRLIALMTEEYPGHDHLVLEGVQDWEKADTILEPLKDIDNAGAVPTGPIEDAVSVIMGADMVVSNDTGIRHVAIVSNVPTVGIFYREPLYRYWPRYGGHDVALPETDGDPPEVDEVHAACVRVMSSTGRTPDTGSA